MTTATKRSCTEMTTAEIRASDTRLGQIWDAEEREDFSYLSHERCPAHQLYHVDRVVYVRGNKAARQAVSYFFDGWIAGQERELNA